MTDTINLLLLGIVQGLTEFLPVSSSGHLALAGWLLDFDAAGLTVAVALHVATLVATLAVVRKDLMSLLRTLWSGVHRPAQLVATEEGRLALSIGLAMIPTAVVGFSLRAWVEAPSPILVGCGFIASAVFLYLTRLGRISVEVPWPLQALLVGLAQGLAVLPGISRSGATIACALFCGLSGERAFRFSFLLALPTIAGAATLEWIKADTLTTDPWALGSGAVVAGLVGYASLRLLRLMLVRGRFWLFSLYLLPLGLFTLLFGFWGWS